MKFLFLLLFLASSTAHAQLQTPIITGVLDVDAKVFLLDKNSIQNFDIGISPRFNKLPFIDGVNNFSVFNKVTGLNDTYIKNNDTFVYATSSILLENNTQGFSKIDSFNPNGATDFGNALVTGVLNFIFD